MNRLKPIGAFICLTLICGARADAQVDRWFLENRGYYDSVLAEPRAAQTTVVFPAYFSSFPYAVNPGRTLGWDISLGHEFPIVGFETNRAGADASGVSPGSFGVGLWFPISFHMIEDLGKDPSSPILDTDYRFSGMLKAQYGLPAKWAGTSASHVGLRFQFGHESTHIGDEFTLGALRTHAADFLRVNVSYEYYDLGGSFEPNFGNLGRSQFKFRAGDIWLWNPANGWYSRSVLQPFGEYVAGSKRNHEPYAQAEWYLAPKGSGRLGYIVSVDIRDRTVYQYRLVATNTVTNTSEPTQLSVNAMAGVRQQRTGAGLLGKIEPTYFVRFYHGVNPNGQFRSQPNFQLLGFGIAFGF